MLPRDDTSLSPQQYIIKVPPDLLPSNLTLQNYVRLFSTTPVVRWLLNTLLIAFCALFCAFW